MVVQCGRRFKLNLRTGEEGFGCLSSICGDCPFQIVKTSLTQRGNHLNLWRNRLNKLLNAVARVRLPT